MGLACLLWGNMSSRLGLRDTHFANERNHCSKRAKRDVPREISRVHIDHQEADC